MTIFTHCLGILGLGCLQHQVLGDVEDQLQGGLLQRPALLKE